MSFYFCFLPSGIFCWQLLHAPNCKLHQLLKSCCIWWGFCNKTELYSFSDMVLEVNSTKWWTLYQLIQNIAGHEFFGEPRLSAQCVFCFDVLSAVQNCAIKYVIESRWNDFKFKMPLFMATYIILYNITYKALLCTSLCPYIWLLYNPYMLLYITKNRYRFCLLLNDKS